jgi:hypothetical protein
MELDIARLRLSDQSNLAIEFISTIQTMLQHGVYVEALRPVLYDQLRKLMAYNNEKLDASEVLLRVISACFQTPQLENLAKSMFEMDVVQCVYNTDGESVRQPAILCGTSLMNLTVWDGANDCNLTSINECIMHQMWNFTGEGLCVPDNRHNVKISGSPSCLILNLGRMVDPTKKFSHFVSYDRELTFNNSNYQLMGVVCHIGDGIDRGHFVTYSCYHGLWSLYDGHKSLLHVTHDEVMNLEAFMLLYHRMDSQELKAPVESDVGGENPSKVYIQLYINTIIHQHTYTMYVCMYVCMYTCVCACMYVCVYACMYVYMICMYVCVDVCMYVCMPVCISMYACMCVCVICIYICMYVCMYACMYVCICVCACMYVCVYDRMYECMYI